MTKMTTHTKTTLTKAKTMKLTMLMAMQPTQMTLQLHRQPLLHYLPRIRLPAFLWNS
jgi:hypothetical protein